MKHLLCVQVGSNIRVFLEVEGHQNHIPCWINASACIFHVHGVAEGFMYELGASVPLEELGLRCFLE